MKPLMEPESVAIVGISRQTGEGSNNILEHILSYGYKGKIFPVNPSSTEILGIKTYSDISSIREKVDLAIIATPREQVPAIVADCARKNIGYTIVVAQGFADAGDAVGKQLQQELDRVIAGSHVRVLGPNTLGTANAFINFSSSFIRVNMKRRPIGLICQTGVFFVGFPELNFIGKAIDMGDCCDIDFNDSLQYFTGDAAVNVIAMHIEGMKNGKRFIDTARRSCLVKPVIVLKSGRGEQAAKAAQSHTGSLTGTDAAWSAAFKQAGIIRVAELDELLDITKAFAAMPLMKNPRIGVVTISGGLGIIAIDACQQSNIHIPSLSPRVKKQFDERFPPYLKPANPVDIWPSLMNSKSRIKDMKTGLDTMLHEPDLGAVLLLSPVFNEMWLSDLNNVLNDLALKYPHKPLACSFWGPYAPIAQEMLQDTGKVAAFPTPERAVRALSRVYEYSRFRAGQT